MPRLEAEDPLSHPQPVKTSQTPPPPEDSPDCCVAVKAAEAAFVIDVLEGDQPLQRIDRFLTGDARLSRRGTEPLKTETFPLRVCTGKRRTSFACRRFLLTHLRCFAVVAALS